MIQKISQIGSYASSFDEYSADYEDLSDGGKYKHLFVLHFAYNANNQLEFLKVDYEEIDDSKNHLYLYKAKQGTGLDNSPCSKITRSFIHTYNLKIFSYFKKHQDKSPFFKSLFQVLEQAKDLIEEQGNELFSKIVGKEGKALTLKINNKYIGEYQEVKEIFNEINAKEYYFRYNIESRSADKTCCNCFLKKEVWGYVNTYNFYTVNEFGMITGGFQKEKAWKNYPVCKSCATLLKTGKNYLDKHLTFSFYGFRYLMIPQVLIDKKESVEELFTILKELSQKITLNKQTTKNISSVEEEVFDILSEQQNFANFTLLFYEESNSAFNIVKHIEDVFPSRLKTILTKANKISQKKYLSFLSKDKETKKTLSFSLWWVLRRKLYPYESKNHTNAADFLSILEKVFKGSKISYLKLMVDMMHVIQKAYKQRYNYKDSAILFYALLELFLSLDLFYGFNKNKEAILMTEQYPEGLENYKKYFDENQDFFNSPAKKLCFLMGNLVQKLLNIQFKNNKATPFEKRLKNLNISQDYLGVLFKETVDKLQQYKQNYYRKLEELISDLFVKSGSTWDIKDKEISFIFTLGLSLEKKFRSSKEDIEEEIE